MWHWIRGSAGVRVIFCDPGFFFLRFPFACVGGIRSQRLFDILYFYPATCRSPKGHGSGSVDAEIPAAFFSEKPKSHPRPASLAATHELPCRPSGASQFPSPLFRSKYVRTHCSRGTGITYFESNGEIWFDLPLWG